MNKLTWTINRLKCMSVGEIGYRLKTKAKTTLEQRGIGLATNVPDPAAKPTLVWLDPDLNSVKPGPYLARADRILTGHFDVFASNNLNLGFPPIWNRDPKTQCDAPLGFGKTLNYRDEKLVGDIKYLWEINRHRELLWLAQAWSLSHETRYLDAITRYLESWFDECPYPLGVNWTSSLEHSVRIITWSGVWSLVGGDDAPLFHGERGKKLRQRWLDSVYQHLHFIGSHFSRYSSANNHLIGEYVGLFVGSCVWPLWDSCEEWRALARSGLEEEARLQTFGDGFNREQAIWYHHEVAELFIISGIVGLSAGESFSKGYWQIVEKMLDATSTFMDVAGQVPAIGDSDDAVYLELGLERDVHRSLLAIGAALFGRADFRYQAGEVMPDKAVWLLGRERISKYVELRPETPRRTAPVALEKAGYYVIGTRLHEAEELRVVLDSGNLGFLSIAAHGHADALSLLLSVAGTPILIDPGTYAYHTEEKWRRYFRGTSAHNTVEIDGEDQSLQAGNFMWLAHAEARCLEFAKSGAIQRWRGEHLGYTRLSDPVVHRRSVDFNEVSSTLEVTDRLLCSGDHAVAIHWHIGANCEVYPNSEGCVIESGPIRVKIALVEGVLDHSVHRGEEHPPLGWDSPSFDLKVPTPTLRFSGAIRGDTSFKTRIEISGAAS